VNLRVKAKQALNQAERNFVVQSVMVDAKLLCHRFQKCIFGIRVELDVDLGGHVI
jgi:hypothetical protein